MRVRTDFNVCCSCFGSVFSLLLVFQNGMTDSPTTCRCYGEIEIEIYKAASLKLKCNLNSLAARCMSAAPSSGLPSPQTNPKILYTGVFINNEWHNSVSGKTFPVYNPSTDEAIANIQAAEKEDVNKAVKAAQNAFQLGSTWRTMNASSRGNLLNRLAKNLNKKLRNLIVENVAETLNNNID